MKKILLFNLFFFISIYLTYNSFDISWVKAQESTVTVHNGYRHLSVDRFNKEGNWKVRYSRYRSKNWDTNFFRDKNDPFIPSENWIKWITANDAVKFFRNIDILPPTTYNKEVADNTNDRTIISIRGEWDKADSNWIFIYPNESRFSEEYYKENKVSLENYYANNINQAQDYIIMPAELISLKVFVWSMGYPYSIEAHFEDYLGNYHSISANKKLNFLGWKEIEFKISEKIKQTGTTLPIIRPLKFLGFKISSTFKDPYKGFYMFMDHIRAKTIIRKEEFLGFNLKRQDIYWNDQKENKENSENIENIKND